MVATVASTAKIQLPVELMTSAHTTPASATPEPAERSVLPDTISMVMPQERTPITVHWVKTLMILSGARNRSDTREAAITTTAKIKRMPKRLKSSAPLVLVASFCFICSPLPHIQEFFPGCIRLCAIHRIFCPRTSPGCGQTFP